jgi:hypothetical protein
LKHNVKIKFDLDKDFKNYEGADLKAHAHEASYDAYMTGYSFINILKYKEFGLDQRPTRGGDS